MPCIAIDGLPALLSSELPTFLPRRVHASIDVGREVDQSDALGAVLDPDERQGDIAGREFPHELLGGEVREEIPQHPIDRDLASDVLLRHQKEHDFYDGVLT